MPAEETVCDRVRELFDGLQHNALDVLAVPPGPRLKTRYENLADAINTPAALGNLVVLAVRNAVALFGAEQSRYEEMCGLLEDNAAALCADPGGLRAIAAILGEIMCRPDQIEAAEYCRLCVRAPEHILALVFCRVAGRVVMARLAELGESADEHFSGEGGAL